MEYLFQDKEEKRLKQKEVPDVNVSNWDKFVCDNYFDIGSAIVRNSYNIELPDFIVRFIVANHPFFSLFQDRYCEYVFRLPQREFRILDRAMNILEVILNCDNLIPKYNQLLQWREERYSRSKFTAYEDSQLACRDVLERVEQSIREQQGLLYEQYVNVEWVNDEFIEMKPIPIIWKLMIDSTGRDNNLHTATGIAPCLGKFSKCLFPYGLHSVMKVPDSEAITNKDFIQSNIDPFMTFLNEDTPEIIVAQIGSVQVSNLFCPNFDGGLINSYYECSPASAYPLWWNNQAHSQVAQNPRFHIFYRYKY